MNARFHMVLFYPYHVSHIPWCEKVQTSFSSPSNCQVCVVAGDDSKWWLRASPMVFPYFEFIFTLGSFIGTPHDCPAQLFFFLSDMLLNMQPEGCQLAGCEGVSLHRSIKQSKQRKTGGKIRSPHLTPNSFGASRRCQL